MWTSPTGTTAPVYTSLPSPITYPSATPYWTGVQTSPPSWTARYAPPTANRDRRTCLHIAAVTNNLPLCHALLDRGADVTAVMDSPVHPRQRPQHPHPHGTPPQTLQQRCQFVRFTSESLRIFTVLTFLPTHEAIRTD